MLKKNKRNICYISVPVAPPESISKHCLWRFEVLLKMQNIKKQWIWRLNLSKKIGHEISRRGVQFLAPESLCSPSYEGLKVHASHSTILEKLKYGICTIWKSENMEFDAETYLKR